jgi:hypothetical protein
VSQHELIGSILPIPLLQLLSPPSKQEPKPKPVILANKQIAEENKLKADIRRVIFEKYAGL